MASRWILPFLLLSTTATLAGEPNSLCKSAQISRLETHQLPAFPFQDYCQLPEEKVPPALVAAIHQIQGIHQELARFFDATPDQLLPKGIPVRIYGQDSGPLASAATPFGMELGVFPDWSSSGEPEEIDAGIYSHEMGHYLSFSGSANLPWSIQKIINSPLADEMFGDLTALGSHGKVFDPIRGLPECAWNARVITDSDSFLVPASRFFATAGLKPVLACCEQEKALLSGSKRFASFCTYMSKAADFMKDLKPPSEATFSAEEYAAHANQYDSHTLGVPMNSFLIDLAAAAGVPAQKLLLRALAEISAEAERAKFACEIPALKPLVGVVAEEMPSVAGAFQKIRSFLDPAQQLQFDTLWQKHGLTILPGLSAIDSREMATQDARSTYASRLRQWISDQVKAGSKKPVPCASGDKSAACTLTCTAN